MKQSRLMSMVEAVTNVAVGYGLAVVTQIIVFPWFGLEAELGEHMAIGMAFVGVSLARSYLLRRLFARLQLGYVRAQKNDDNDAAGIAEAATRPTMRFVEMKSQDRLDLQTLHRVRSRLITARKALLNQLRAILLERGHTFRQGRKVLERELGPFLAEPPLELSPRIVTLIEDMRAEWRSLDERIDGLNDDLADHARHDAAARRLTSIPGIGVLGATALVAAVGDGKAFRRARDMPAWLGLVPRQMTTGGKPRLLGITKRGNRYLRTLLIHGARAALPSLSRQETALGAWLRALLARAHRNVVIVALAAKLARIAWASLRHNVDFEPAWEQSVTA